MRPTIRLPASPKSAIRMGCGARSRPFSSRAPRCGRFHPSRDGPSSSADGRNTIAGARRRTSSSPWIRRTGWPAMSWAAATVGAARPLFRDIPNYGLFADLFADFPAHFHINCRPDVRGRGVGGRLAERFVSLCEAAGLPGVHVVTAEGARNVAFYRARGFDRAVERTAGEKTLLFLGRRL